MTLRTVLVRGYGDDRLRIITVKLSDGETDDANEAMETGSPSEEVGGEDDFNEDEEAVEIEEGSQGIAHAPELEMTTPSIGLTSYDVRIGEKSSSKRKKSFMAQIFEDFTPPLIGNEGTSWSPAPASGSFGLVQTAPSFSGTGIAPFGQSSSLGHSQPSFTASSQPGIFHPNWVISTDSDGQYASFGSEYAPYAFPPAMTSRLDNMEETDFQREQYSYVTNSMAYAASSARRGERKLREVKGQVEAATKNAQMYRAKCDAAVESEQKYKETYEQMVKQCSSMKLERDSLAAKVEEYGQKETQLEANIVQHQVEMNWMLQHGVQESFDHTIRSPVFVGNSRRLYKAFSDAGMEQGTRATREKFCPSIPDEELPFYQSGRREELQQAMSSFEETDYMAQSGLDMSSYSAFRGSFSWEEGDV